MAQLSKTSLSYYLSEYLADLQRAGVQDVWRGDDVKSEEPPPTARRQELIKP